MRLFRDAILGGAFLLLWIAALALGVLFRAVRALSPAPTAQP